MLCTVSLPLSACFQGQLLLWALLRAPREAGPRQLFMPGSPASAKGLRALLSPPVDI